MLGMTNHIVSILFREQQGIPVFGVTFSLNRHEYLVSPVRLDDFTTKLAKYGYCSSLLKLVGIGLLLLPQSMQKSQRRINHV